MADAKIVISADTRQAEAALGNVDKALNSIQGSSALASRALGAVTAALSVGKLIQLADAATTVNNKMASITGSSAEAAKAFKTVTDIASRTGQSLEATADLYQKIALNSKQLGLSQAETARVTENFSKALAITGTTGASAASAIYQFGQAIGRGKVAYEDIRQIQEVSAGTLALVAKQFGMTTQEFITAVQAGKISGEQFALAVNKMGADVNPVFDKMNKTVGQSMENIRTSFIKVLDNFEKSTGTFDKIAKVLGFVADNMEAITVAAGIFMTVFAVKKILDIATAFGTLNSVMKKNPILFLAVTAATAGGAMYEYFFGKAGADKTIKDTEAVGDAMRGVDDVRKKSEQEITKEQMLGLEAFLKSLDAKAKAANLTGVELEFQTLLSAVAKELKITEEEITAAVRTRLRTKAEEIQAGKDLKITTDSLVASAQAITAAGIDDNAQRQIAVKLAELRKSLGRDLTAQEEANARAMEMARLSAEGLLAVKQQTAQSQTILNSLSITDLDTRQETLAVEQARLQYGKAFTSEIEAQVRANVKNLQSIRDMQAVEQARRSLSGTMSMAESVSRGVSVSQRVDPNTANQVAYAQDQQALKSLLDQKLISEQAYQENLLKLKTEYADKANQLYISQVENEKQQRTTQIQAEQMMMGKTAEQARTYAEFEMKTTAEKTQFALEQGANIFNALGAQNKKAFEAAKAFNIANAIMNTYMAVTKALASYPFPFSLIAAGGALAFGLAQVGQIRSQQYSGRALGGPVMGNQSYIVGENGPEMFTPATSGRITRNDQLGGGGTTNISFTIVANDTEGFDQLLTSRKGVIQQIISDAMLERGQRM